MIRKITVPKLSTNVEEVTITRWYRREGDPIAKGEPIAELTTDKASFDLESPVAGTLRRILADAKSTLPIGYVIALIGSPIEDLPDPAEANRKLLEKHRAHLGAAAKPAAPAGKAAAESASTAPHAAGGVIRATPAARRLAKEHGLNLAAVKASCPTLEILNEDAVRQHLTSIGKA